MSELFSLYSSGNIHRILLQQYGAYIFEHTDILNNIALTNSTYIFARWRYHIIITFRRLWSHASTYNIWYKGYTLSCGTDRQYRLYHINTLWCRGHSGHISGYNWPSYIYESLLFTIYIMQLYYSVTCPNTNTCHSYCMSFNNQQANCLQRIIFSALVQQ